MFYFNLNESPAALMEEVISLEVVLSLAHL
jgi:hypothetical protein